MNRMFRNRHVFIACIVLIMLLSACVAVPSPTLPAEPGAVETWAASTLSAQSTQSAVQTFAAQLTQFQIATEVAATSMAIPSDTATEYYTSPTSNLHCNPYTDPDSNCNTISHGHFNRYPNPYRHTRAMQPG